MNIGEVVKAAIATMRSIGWFGLKPTVSTEHCISIVGKICDRTPLLGRTQSPKQDESQISS